MAVSIVCSLPRGAVGWSAVCDCGISCFFIVTLLSIFINRLSLTVKAATLIFISWRGSAISSAKQGKSCSIFITW